MDRTNLADPSPSDPPRHWQLSTSDPLHTIDPPTAFDEVHTLTPLVAFDGAHRLHRFVGLLNFSDLHKFEFIDDSIFGFKLLDLFMILDFTLIRWICCWFIFVLLIDYSKILFLDFV